MSAVRTVSGWRVYVTNGDGLFSPLVNGFDRAVNRSQDAVCLCDPPCREVPGPTGRCGWYATEDVFDLHDVVVGLSMLSRRREDVRRDLRGLYDLALTGVEVTFPLSTPMSPTSSAERRRVRGSATVVFAGPSTHRGRRLTITGPIITTLADPAAIERLSLAYEVDVVTAPIPMVDVVLRLRDAARACGKSPEALRPHLGAVLTPVSAGPITQRSTMPNTTPRETVAPRKTAAARRKMAAAPQDHLPPGQGKDADGYQAFELDGVPLRVKPFTKWRSSALRAVREGADFDRWAETSLHPDDVQKFFDLDPEMGELTRFITELTKRLEIQDT